MGFFDNIGSKIRNAGNIIASKVSSGSNFIAHKAVPFANNFIDNAEKIAGFAQSVVNFPGIRTVMDANPRLRAIKAGINASTGALEAGRKIVNKIGQGAEMVADTISSAQSGQLTGEGLAKKATDIYSTGRDIATIGKTITNRTFL